MIRDPNMIKHLPLFMQEYREVKQVMAAENPEFKLVIEESEVIKNNQFVVSCDAKGIKRFEQILGIAGAEQDHLQLRIARVLMRWNDMVPYSFGALLERLDIICGKGNYTAVEKPNQYAIALTLSFDTIPGVENLVQDITAILQTMLPANLTHQLNIVARSNVTSMVRCGVAATACVWYGVWPGGLGAQATTEKKEK